jgi:hypothetical protein
MSNVNAYMNGYEPEQQPWNNGEPGPCEHEYKEIEGLIELNFSYCARCLKVKEKKPPDPLK